MTWIQTAKGHAFNVLEPRPEDIDFEEIAFALSRINRFIGHTGWSEDLSLRHPPYSVAQHCVIGTDWLISQGKPGAALAFLLHDAHEAYIGDIASPLIEAFSAVDGFRMCLDHLREKIDIAICVALDLDGVLNMHSARVRDTDLAMLRTERDQLMLPPPRHWGPAVERASPLPVVIARIASPSLVERQWLDRLQKLVPDFNRRVRCPNRA